jgi:hypothetical protein
MDPVRGDLANPLSWNAYSYALGNPLRYTDPWGLVDVDGNGGHADGASGDAGSMPRFWGWITVTGDDPYNSERRLQDAQLWIQSRLLEPNESYAAYQRYRVLSQIRPRPNSSHGTGFSLWTVPGPFGSEAAAHSSTWWDLTTWNDIGQDLEGGWDIAFKTSYGLAGLSAGSALIVGGSPTITAGARWFTSVANRGLVQIFGKGTWMNSGQYLRVGFGRIGGRRVFRIGGEWVKRVTGRSHLDIWKGGPL